MTNLDVTLTLAEYVRRMSSADANEWLPTPSETRVMWDGHRVVEIRVANICGQVSYEVWGDGKFLFADTSEHVTVSPVMY